MVVGPVRLEPVNDCTANKPVHSSERALHFNIQVNVRLMEIKGIMWLWAHKGIPGTKTD
jgi:hypothetical protein